MERLSKPKVGTLDYSFLYSFSPFLFFFKACGLIFRIKEIVARGPLFVKSLVT